MERIKPLTASITGIDGSGKSTVSDMVAQHLSQRMDVAKTGSPTYAINNGEQASKYANLTTSIDALRTLARKTHMTPAVLAVNAVDVISQGRIIEPGIKSINPDVLLSTRDYIIDPTVYATFYSPMLSKCLTREQRLRFFQQLTNLQYKDVIFHLQVSPDEAVSRIKKRQADKPHEKIHPHEGEKHLENLQAEYVQTLAEVRRKGVKSIYEINTSEHTPAQVADFVTSKLEHHISRSKTLFDN